MLVKKLRYVDIETPHSENAYSLLTLWQTSCVSLLSIQAFSNKFNIKMVKSGIDCIIYSRQNTAFLARNRSHLVFRNTVCVH